MNHATLLSGLGYKLDDHNYVWRKPDYLGIAYNDGDEIETRIANAIAGAQDISVLSLELRQHCIDWPSLYHLTSARANLMRPFESHFCTDASVLEIGAGCGAITRYLGECGAQVLALEGTPRRAAIARSRTRDLSNVTVLSERFNDFAPNTKFDVVTLIGVLEYANLFTPTANPHLSMLERVRQLLNPKGLLIIAIENQLGLKYFAGAPEDHLGQPMYGIEGRYQPSQPQTFGLKAIKALLHQAGFAQQQFMSPLPDYKLPSSIITESGFANPTFDSGALAWQSARSDPQLPGQTNFSLELAWPEIDKNGLALDLANSFLIAATPEVGQWRIDPSILAFHYSANRRPEFCKQTVFIQTGDVVELNVSRMVEPRNGRVQGEILNQSLEQYVQPYAQGEPLSKRFIKLVTKDDWSLEHLQDYLETWFKILQYQIKKLGSDLDLKNATVNTLIPGECIDCVAQNIIMTEGQIPAYIDREWTSDQPIKFGHLIFRQSWMLMQSVSCFSRCIEIHPMTRETFILQVFKLLKLKVSTQDIAIYELLEAQIQQTVGSTHQEPIDWGLKTALNYYRVGRQNAHLLAQRDAQLAGKDVQLAEKDVQLAEKESQTSLSAAQVEKQKAALEQLKNELHQVHLQNHFHFTQWQQIQTSFAWRMTKPLRKTVSLLPAPLRRALRKLISVTLGRVWRAIKSKDIGNFLTSREPSIGLANLGILSDKGQSQESQINSSMNHAALHAIVEERLGFSTAIFLNTPIQKCSIDVEPIDVDISLVTYNSGKWLERFFASVEQLDYPLTHLKIFARDNGSTDDTVFLLENANERLKQFGIVMHISRGANVGFGAGHNSNIKLGKAPLILVSNVDLFFEPSSLKEVVAQANRDKTAVVAWEFRQKPYEHPKYYDPVTGLTNWNSHACVLMRRDGFQSVGGYDENIFMYGEDVDLSYNFRANGLFIKYLPKAVVWHDTYEDVGKVKPLQYEGSTFASLYLRAKYGTIKDIMAIPKLQRMLLDSPAPYEGAHDAVRANGRKLWAKAFSALTKRRQTKAFFPFRAFDYDLTRSGAFHKLENLPVDGPLVSVITRTYVGRATYLRQAIISVANQTYPNIEHIVVEDGGTTHQSLCQHATSNINPRLKYLSVGKVGRCVTGNRALEEGQGRYCLFLDDDDLLFSDHVEVLLAALLKAPAAAAAYSPAMEIHTDVLDKETGKYIETQYSFPAGLSQEYSYEILTHHNYIAIQSILFDRQLFVERGGFDINLDYLEDWNLWVRYGWQNTFVFVPKLTSMYRVPASEIEYQRRFNLLNDAYEGVCQANAKALTLLGRTEETPIQS
jgi:GT2 family glycosyltransferase